MFLTNKIILSRCKVLWCIIPFPLKTSYDDVVDTESSALLRKEKSEETGMDRIRAMFTLKNNEVSEELHSCVQSGFTGLLFGAVYGGFIQSRRAYLEFFENNQATAFESHWEAKKVLQNHVTVNFAKGAIAWGWRIGMFTGSLVLVSTLISLYRGKFGIIEYTIAGGVTGCLFRTNLGFRGMIVGGLLGTAVGTIGGTLVFGILKICGVTMDDIRSVQYKTHIYRQNAILLRDKRGSEEGSKEELYLRSHDLKVKIEGGQSDILPK